MTSLDRGRSRAAADDLPPALSSMWRLCKLGYRHEPRLLVDRFFLRCSAALPDALMALWLASSWATAARRTERSGLCGGRCARRVGGGHLVPANDQHRASSAAFETR